MDKIGVGIIGASQSGSWASAAHIPALKNLPEYELCALSTRSQKTANEAGKAFDVPRCFDNHTDLIACPQVDLVVVAVKVPHHFELVTAVLEKGKSVYCEWPLGNGLEEAIKMADMAREKGVQTAVGLQARSAPCINYVRDLIQQGYVGDVLSTTLIGSGMVWGPVVDQRNTYLADIRNGATMLTIPFGHTVDALCYCLGEFAQVSATTAVRRKQVAVVGTNEVIPNTSPDQIGVTGILESGAVATVHYRGGQSRGTNLLWEINGTDGDLQVTASSGHAQMAELTLLGGHDTDKSLSILPIPEEYTWIPAEMPQSPAINVAQAYSRFAKDMREGTRLCPTFDDAVQRHHLISTIETAARTGQSQRVRPWD